MLPAKSLTWPTEARVWASTCRSWSRKNVAEPAELARQRNRRRGPPGPGGGGCRSGRRVGSGTRRSPGGWSTGRRCPASPGCLDRLQGGEFLLQLPLEGTLAEDLVLQERVDRASDAGDHRPAHGLDRPAARVRPATSGRSAGGSRRWRRWTCSCPPSPATAGTLEGRSVRCPGRTWFHRASSSKPTPGASRRGPHRS